MRKKMKNSDLLNFKWCIENDLQVYIKPEHSFARICIRRGGITSEGKDYYYTNGIRVNTPEQRGTVLYKSQDLAAKELNRVYKYLRDENTKRLPVGERE